jgi:hypothetical protein
MQSILPNYLRDVKTKWKWPKHFPECQRASELRVEMKKAIDENWDMKIEEIYK